MPSVSYIRHQEEPPSSLESGSGYQSGGGGGGGDSGVKSPNLALMQKQGRKEQQKRDEFDTEDGFLAFSLALHNLLITCSWVLVLANVTGWHKMTFIGIISVVVHLVLTEVLMKGVRKNKLKLVVPWVLITVIEEVTLVVLSIGWMSHSLEGVSFGEGFSIIGAFFVVNTALTGVRYFITAKTVLNCYRTQYQKI